MNYFTLEFALGKEGDSWLSDTTLVIITLKFHDLHQILTKMRAYKL